jgi:hypothetical protein
MEAQHQSSLPALNSNDLCKPTRMQTILPILYMPWETTPDKAPKQCLNKAKFNQDEAAEQFILQIIQRAKTCAFWRKLNRALGAHRGTSIRSV